MENNKTESATTLSDTVLADVPVMLHESLQRDWSAFVEAAHGKGIVVTDNEDFLKILARVWGCSDFVAKACVRSPQMLIELVGSGDLTTAYEADRYQQELGRAFVGMKQNETALGRLLRHYRRREMVRIAWRDIAGWSSLDETLRDLSALAQACVNSALDILHQWQCEALGRPIGRESGELQSMLVLGMGKLGADELNFSSDIDLIFAYPEEGETQGGRKPLTNGEYFLKLGRSLINVINQQTPDGFVFRVDMRLRPFGESGPLAVNFDALESYYQSHGREWERYAMIKASVIAGPEEAGKELMTMLRPFVYRRYIDYGVFESLREMKSMIAREVKRKGMEDNIKLGPGGIREIEFIGQAYQLVRGGRDKDLQIRPIQQVLALLAEKEYMPEYVADSLQQAYIFLRVAENRLQAIADQQTHTLPKNEIDRCRLSYAMGFSNWDEFESALRRCMEIVHEAFEQEFAAPQREQGSEQGSLFELIWKGGAQSDSVLEQLKLQGYEDAKSALELISGFRDGGICRRLSTKGRERMDALMPLLLGAVATTNAPEVVLGRVIKQLETIARRSSYLALLVENPVALSQLVKLCAASPWIADYLAKYPVLLDELLDARSLYSPLNRKGLELELEFSLIQAEGDLEQQMERLRHFKHANVLRVAAADISGVYPLMVVSDHLTEIAEVVLNAVVKIAYNYLAEKHGHPECTGPDGVSEPGFLVLAYGKLGGIELGYGSDLDLVFLHGNYKNGGQTSGPSVTDNTVFFARLGQRIIHIVTTLMPAGVLYEVDSRLRPSGNSGLLVSPFNAYAKYQENEAWTWEHQALVRARPVVGGEGLGKRFDVVRAKVLGKSRDPQQLQTEVREMREKMREHLSKSQEGMFDLKQDHGGIADIEFIVQFAVLRWAHDYPSLLKWTDNIRLLETLAQELLLTKEDAALLADAYRAYRAKAHRLALQGEPGVVAGGEFEEYKKGVARIWRDLLETVK